MSVRSRDEVGRLAEAFNRMAVDLRRHQEQVVGQERLRKELEMCRRIQEELLLRAPLLNSFADIKGLSIPAREVGGDFFNYFTLPMGPAAILVGDVSGKGVPAALLMANLQATLRARLPLETDLAHMAECLDREIEGSTPAEAYLSLFVGILDGDSGILRWVNAGHNTQYLVRASGEIEPLDSTGRPLGLLPGGGYTERRTPMGPGDSLFLFTDGLIDTENEAGEAFGVERLRGLLQASGGHGIDRILADVEQAVREFRGRADAVDDATMLVVNGHRAASA